MRFALSPVALGASRTTHLVVFYYSCYIIDITCQSSSRERCHFYLIFQDSSRKELTMIDILKKTYLAGLGLAAKTWAS